MKRTAEDNQLYPYLPQEIIFIIFQFMIASASSLEMITLRLLGIVNTYTPFSDAERNFYVTKMLDFTPIDNDWRKIILVRENLYTIYQNFKFHLHNVIMTELRYAEKNKSNSRRMDVLDFVALFEKDAFYQSIMDPLIFRKNIMRILIIIKEILNATGWTIIHSAAPELTLNGDSYITLFKGYLYLVKI